MKKEKLLFVASLPTKKFNFDGERNKSKDVLNALCKTNKYKITIINFSRNKYIQMLKLIICQLFKNYDRIFISKCIVGGSFALHILNKIKKNKNIFFYIIGNGYYGFDDKTIYFHDISLCNKLIVESENVKESMIAKGANPEKIAIFPCLKPLYDIDFKEKEYKPNQPLKLLFFSRINPEKGLGDIMKALIELNSESKETKFYLDIAGGVSNEPGIKEFNEYVLKTCSEHPFLNYLGMTLRADGLESYKLIQEYDLHVFPSRFKQECAPGSILDMFVAGVPTLSSKFPSYKGLIDDENSILFEQSNYNDLKEKLIFIYNNASKILNTKRKLSHNEYYKYTDEAFLRFLDNINF